MTPRKIERGRQPGRNQDLSDRRTSHSDSGQKRRSASQGRDEVDLKKGRMEGHNTGTSSEKSRKVLDLTTKFW